MNIMWILIHKLITLLFYLDNDSMLAILHYSLYNTTIIQLVNELHASNVGRIRDNTSC